MSPTTSAVERAERDGRSWLLRAGDRIELTLLDRVPIEAHQIHRMEGERTDQDEAARAYEAETRCPAIRRVSGAESTRPLALA